MVKSLLERWVSGPDTFARRRRHSANFDHTQVDEFTYQHALRDIIQNALDASDTLPRIVVQRERRRATITDSGSGFHHYHLRNASTTKPQDSKTDRGRFGRGGTKEAPLILTLDGVEILYRSQDWVGQAVLDEELVDGDLKRILGYEIIDLKSRREGTQVVLAGLTDPMMDYLDDPGAVFLPYRPNVAPLYENEHGDQIIGTGGEVFIRDIKVGDWGPAELSYNLWSLRAPQDRKRDIVPEEKTRTAIRRLLRECDNPAVIRAVLEAAHKHPDRERVEHRYAATYHRTERLWKEGFAHLFGSRAVLHDPEYTGSKRRVAFFTRRVGATPVHVPYRLRRNLRETGIPKDSQLVPSHQDLIWGDDELAKMDPDYILHTDVPLRADAPSNFHFLYTVLHTQHERNPGRFALSYVMRDPTSLEDKTEVVLRENLGRWICDKELVQGVTALQVQNDLDSRYKGTEGASTFVDIVTRHAKQVRIGLGDEDIPLYHVGEVGVDGASIVAQDLALLAHRSIRTGERMILKGRDWVGIPTRRRSRGETRYVLDTFHGVSDATDEQYVAFTDSDMILQTLHLGRDIRGVRLPSSPQPLLRADTTRVTMLEARRRDTEVYASGFRLVNPPRTVLEYDLPYSPNDLQDPGTLTHVIQEITEATTDVPMLRRILRAAFDYADAGDGTTPDAPYCVEFGTSEGYYLEQEPRKAWAQAFTQEFGSRAVLNSRSEVQEREKIYGQQGKHYSQLAADVGYDVCDFSQGIRQTLMRAGVLTDKRAVSEGVEFSTVSKTSGKHKPVYRLGSAVAAQLGDAVTTASGTTHHYEIHFFRTAKLHGGVTTQDLRYAKTVDTQETPGQTTHHLYVNTREAAGIVDAASAQAFVDNVIGLALDEKTAVMFAQGTVARTLAESVKQAGQYRTRWRQLISSLGDTK